MIDIIWSICLVVIGVPMLITPSEKLQEKYPKMKSPTLLRVAGVIVIVVAILNMFNIFS